MNYDIAPIPFIFYPITLLMAIGMITVAESTVQDDLNRPSHYALFREVIPSFRLHSDLNMPISSFEPLRHLLKMYWSGLIDEEALVEQLKTL